jgi:chaperonin GroEL
VALINAIDAIKDLKNDNPDINTGINIVRRALEEPMRQLARNGRFSLHVERPIKLTQMPAAARR